MRNSGLFPGYSRHGTSVLQNRGRPMTCHCVSWFESHILKGLSLRQIRHIIPPDEPYDRRFGRPSPF
ncbi:hypothetical protein SCLCIDRAFT_553838 [Scleroderma citrinum Foug A]|uniref:Uncharacterized protein n=1 Tax=Scleroderma citrinum Foug A TaxID=1036808 RepID=A0A0C2YS09_9AGAM|nr:hypothetical protein SCLCIDRAFT_553838 [Scleroderma citrinum Foug A]